ncbi:MAG: sulfurtransferase-like selenium metabolism protein YedF [Bacteroides sp.]
MAEVVDCRGMICPLPIITLKRRMGELAPGEELEVAVDNRQASINVTHFLQEYYGIAVQFSEEAGVYRTTFRNGEPLAGAVPDASQYSCAPTGGKPASVANGENGMSARLAPMGTVVLCPSNAFGNGEQTLGEILMKGFLSTLEAWPELPHALIFLNSGVKLAAEGSGALDTLRNLEQKGVKILVCGTCVEFYKLADAVRVGVVSNMFTISGLLQQASKVIRI